MYSSRDLRSRRYSPYQPQEERRGIKPGWFILGGVALILIFCCCCAFLGIAYWQGWFSKLPSLPSLPRLPSTSSSPAKTAAPDPSKPVAMQARALGDNGLEVTVLNFQPNLKVEGFKNPPANNKFILLTLRVRNSKSTGAAIPISAKDFTLQGDGGLTYQSNPANIGMPNLLTQATIPPGKTVEPAELIFQIAVDDTGLRLTWNSGGSNRIFIIEESK